MAAAMTLGTTRRSCRIGVRHFDRGRRRDRARFEWSCRWQRPDSCLVVLMFSLMSKKTHITYVHILRIYVRPIGSANTELDASRARVPLQRVD
jgi:hypothetical protein